MNRLIAFVLALSLSIPQSPAHALDTIAPKALIILSPIELLANDKEEKSILIKEKNVRSAYDEMGVDLSARPQFEKVAAVLADLVFVSEGAMCEIGVLQKILDSARLAGLRSDPAAIEPILILLRSMDLIDDVILFPLLKIVPSFLELPAYQPPTKPISSGVIASELTEEESVARAHSFKLLGGTSQGCPTDSFFKMQRTLMRTEVDHYHRRHLRKEIDQALEFGIISNDQATWLTSLFEHHFDRVPFSLGQAVNTMRKTKNRTLFYLEKRSKSGFASKVKKGSKGLTYRMSLYAKYDWQQIDKLKEILRAYELEAGPGSSSTDYHAYRDDFGNPQVRARHRSATAHLNAMAAWLHNDIVELSGKGDGAYLFHGEKIDYEDLVTAALESGYISGYEVDTVLKVKEIWDPKVSLMSKILSAVQKYGSAAFILLPAPYATLAAITIVFLQTKVFKDKSKDPKVVDTGVEPN